MARARQAVPEGYHTVTPSLTFDDAAAAIAWYQKALNAKEVSRAVGPDGKIMHAELQIGDSRVMLNDAVMGLRGPKAMGGSPISLWRTERVLWTIRPIRPCSISIGAR